MEKIPESFQSVEHYLGSYVNPLLEETRAELHSSMEMLYGAPFTEVVAFEEAKPYGPKLYRVRVNHWRNKLNNSGKEPYKTLPGDIFVLVNDKPETVCDLKNVGMSWAFLSLIDIRGDGNTTQFKVKASKEFKHETWKQTSLYLIFLANVIPHIRIWEALHMSSNLEMINEVLCNNSTVSLHTIDFVCTLQLVFSLS